MKQSLRKTKTFITSISPKTWLIGGFVIAAILYSVAFFIPHTVQFSYAAQTCVGQFMLAPTVEKVDSSQFDIQFKDPLNIGGVQVATKTMCVTPKISPKAGTFAASIAPFGGIFARTQLNIDVPSSPVAQASGVIGKSISTAQPLKIQLTSADIIHQYVLKVGDKTAACTVEGTELSCDIASLNLQHGTTYTIELHQLYRGTDIKIFDGSIQTLQPLGLSSTSITDGQTIYDSPTNFSFTFDQAVASSDITLVEVRGDTTVPVSLTKAVQGQKVTVSFADLAREANYKLMLNQAIGQNGSSLAQPVTLSFQTSGGPKVTDVSVGSNSVSRNATIVVTFDQPIDPTVDLTAFAHAQGVTATVSRQSDTQLAFKIQGGDCAAFTLTVDKGLKSGSNSAASTDPWTFSSRTICGYSWVIGQSVLGRSIVAYSFGSGSSTILFTGGMHGSEQSGYNTMLAWAQYLQAYGNIIPSDKRVVIVPNTNPDGIAADTRYNYHNVNIDRNFPTADWSASIQTASGTLPAGGGTSAGSEPETAALMALTSQLKPRLEVSFHAQGSLVGANKYADSTSIGDLYAGTVGYTTMFYDAEAVMGYPMTGEYEDWIGEQMNLPAILVELPSDYGNYLTSQLSALKKMLAT